MFWVLDYLALGLAIVCAVAIVRVPNVNSAVLCLSGVGTALTVLFVLLGAPDDAHAEIVVGAIALPTLYLVAIGKVRAVVEDESETYLGDEDPGGSGAGPT